MTLRTILITLSLPLIIMAWAYWDHLRTNRAIKRNNSKPPDWYDPEHERQRPYDWQREDRY